MVCARAKATAHQSAEAGQDRAAPQREGLPQRGGGVPVALAAGPVEELLEDERVEVVRVDPQQVPVAGRGDRLRGAGPGQHGAQRRDRVLYLAAGGRGGRAVPGGFRQVGKAHRAIGVE